MPSDASRCSVTAPLRIWRLFKYDELVPSNLGNGCANVAVLKGEFQLGILRLKTCSVRR